MPRLAGGLAAALLLAACGAENAPEQDSTSPEPVPVAAASGECLVLVWQKQDAPDEPSTARTT